MSHYPVGQSGQHTTVYTTPPCIFLIYLQSNKTKGRLSTMKSDVLNMSIFFALYPTSWHRHTLKTLYPEWQIPGWEGNSREAGPLWSIRNLALTAGVQSHPTDIVPLRTTNSLTVWETNMAWPCGAGKTMTHATADGWVGDTILLSGVPWENRLCFICCCLTGVWYRDRHRVNAQNVSAEWMIDFEFRFELHFKACFSILECTDERNIWCNLHILCQMWR